MKRTREDDSGHSKEAWQKKGRASASEYLALQDGYDRRDHVGNILIIAKGTDAFNELIRYAKYHGGVFCQKAFGAFFSQIWKIFDQTEGLSVEDHEVVIGVSWGFSAVIFT